MKACPPTTFPQETMASQQRRIGPGGQAKARTRPAGRVILLDPDDRVLLMRYDDGPPNGIHWSTPGGGLIPGGDFWSGAVRELAEETAWDGIVLRGRIYRWTAPREDDDGTVRQARR